MNRDPWWLRVADRAYALALHAYPRDFREAWGPQMRQTLRDRWRDSAKDGRSALAAGFALFQDLLASAGREQLHAFHEEAAMKRALLGLALLSSVALFAMQGRMSTGVAEWQEARTWSAVDAAYRTELRGIASSSPSSGIRALAWTLDDPDAQRHTAPARTPGAVVHDRLADFLAAASCGDPATLARLEATEPGNGAVWAVAATCAQRTKRADVAREALARLAQSDRYDSRSGALLAAATELAKRTPPPQVFMPGDSPTGLDYLGNILWNAHTPEFEAFVQACRPSAIGTDAALANMCRTAAGVMSRADSDWVREFGAVLTARLDGRQFDKAKLHEEDMTRQKALAKWWALDDSTRAARTAAGGSEVELLAH